MQISQKIKITLAKMRERTAGNSAKYQLIDELEAELQQSAAESACLRCEKATIHFWINKSKSKCGWFSMVCAAGVAAEDMNCEACTDESNSEIGGSTGDWSAIRSPSAIGRSQQDRQAEAQNFLTSRLRPAPGRGD